MLIEKDILEISYYYDFFVKMDFEVFILVIY